MVFPVPQSETKVSISYNISPKMSSFGVWISHGDNFCLFLLLFANFLLKYGRPFFPRVRNSSREVGMFPSFLVTIVGLVITGILAIKAKKAYDQQMVEQNKEYKAFVNSHGKEPYGWTNEPIYVFYIACMPHALIATILWVVVWLTYYRS